MLQNLKIYGSSFVIVSSFTLIGLSGCATAPHVEKYSIPNDFRQVIPFKNVDGDWVLPVAINDIELNLVLDTGASRIALYENQRTQAFFDSTNSSTKTRAFDRSGPSVRSKLMKNATLTMEGFLEQNVNVALFQEEQSPIFPWNTDKIDGAIGFDLLSKYDVRIDNQTMLATFMRGGTLTRSTDKRHFPIKFIGKIPAFEGKLRFPYSDHDEKLSVIIDTGSDASIIIFTSENVSTNIDTPAKKTYIKTISGVKKYTKVDDVVITATNGNFSFKAGASVKVIENIKTRASIGMPALSGDIVEISYTSKFISVNDEIDPPS